jgi:hypothetical protein
MWSEAILMDPAPVIASEARQRASGAPPFVSLSSLACFALRLKPRKTGNPA